MLSSVGNTLQVDVTPALCLAGLRFGSLTRWHNAAPVKRVISEFVAFTCCVPLEPPGLCPVVISGGALRQDLDCLAEQLKCSVQIPSLCRWDTLHLQLFHLPQQLCVKTTVWQGEINRLKKHSISIGKYRRKGKHKKHHSELSLDYDAMIFQPGHEICSNKSNMLGHDM